MKGLRGETGAAGQITVVREASHGATCDENQRGIPINESRERIRYHKMIGMSGTRRREIPSWMLATARIGPRAPSCCSRGLERTKKEEVRGGRHAPNYHDPQPSTALNTTAILDGAVFSIALNLHVSCTTQSSREGAIYYDSNTCLQVHSIDPLRNDSREIKCITERPASIPGPSHGNCVLACLLFGTPRDQRRHRKSKSLTDLPDDRVPRATRTSLPCPPENGKTHSRPEVIEQHLHL